MIPRYETMAMKNIWSDSHKFALWLEIEIAHASASELEPEALEFFKKKHKEIDWQAFSKRVAEHESYLKHDVIAFLRALEDECGAHAKNLHRGLTSSDIVDSAFALQLKQASEHLEKKLSELISALWQKAQDARGKLCLGRTHGQAAQPMTFGIKILSHVCELSRGLMRLALARENIEVAKLSGAVGTYAYSGIEVEKRALKALGLEPENVATQIIARDRHAQFFTTLAIVGGSLERLALELRLLGHGELLEACEPFSHKQQGSSAMPHKKNPVLCENISGLMRLVRSYALASLENQALWHERDISHSSVERIVAPDACNVMDFALTRMIHIIEGLVLSYERMKAHLDKAGDSLASQALMIALIDKGLNRSEAYELVQRAALHTQLSFKDALLALGIKEWLALDELDALLAMPALIKSEEVLFQRAYELAHKATHNAAQTQLLKPSY